MINVHYALQVCDAFSNSREHSERYCSNDRTLISKKCIKSFMESVKYVSKEKPEVLHTIKIFNDHSSDDLVSFVEDVVKQYSSENIIIEVESLSESGIMYSIGKCYEWLKENGKDLVYQVQDDYLFKDDAIFQMIDIFMQVFNDIETMPIVSPFNYPHYWNCKSYKYKSTPRMIVPGKNQYWIQCYDISCSFLTGHQQFVNNWDMIEYFLTLDPTGGETGDLENISLNRILVDRQQLGLTPFNSLNLHMQSEFEKDPYTDWVSLWNKQDTENRIIIPDKALLNIGCGPNKLNFKSLSQFKEISFDADVTIKPDIVGDITNLDIIPTNSIDVFWASHVLEHIHTLQVMDVLKNMNRILKEDGLGIILVPNLKSLGKQISKGTIHQPVYVSPGGPITPMDMLYGGVHLSKDNDFMYHKTGFTPEYASLLLTELKINGYVNELEHSLFILITKKQLSEVCVDIDEILKEYYTP